MLLRFDPFRELDRLTETARTPVIPFDAVRRGETVELRFDLPGVAASDIDLEVERNVLTVKATRTWEQADDEQVLASERRHGTFTRQLLLGETLDTNRVEADYADGVLTVRLPVAETAKARKVSVGGGGERKAIDADSAEGAPSSSAA